VLLGSKVLAETPCINKFRPEKKKNCKGDSYG
jgi:hypothetical protein